jgi:V-type H+-transporting ATPase subunit C
VYSEYLTTLVAIVPKQQIKDFLECYEFLHENVVPKSAKYLHFIFIARQFQIDDKDNLTIWRVVLVK